MILQHVRHVLEVTARRSHNVSKHAASWHCQRLYFYEASTRAQATYPNTQIPWHCQRFYFYEASTRAQATTERGHKRGRIPFFDQCQFGLKHPALQEPMQKSTRVQTSSEEMFRSLDNRLCSKDHAHAHVAGSCTVDGKRVQVSRFSAFYPKVLAKKIAEVIMRPVHEHVTVPTMVVQQDCFPVRKLEDPASPLENKTKRSRVQRRKESQ